MAHGRRLALAGAAVVGLWSTIAAADVPPGAGRLVILLGVSGQEDRDDAVWFDDVLAVRID